MPRIQRRCFGTELSIPTPLLWQGKGGSGRLTQRVIYVCASGAVCMIRQGATFKPCMYGVH